MYFVLASNQQLSVGAWLYFFDYSPLPPPQTQAQFVLDFFLFYFFVKLASSCDKIRENCMGL